MTCFIFLTRWLRLLVNQFMVCVWQAGFSSLWGLKLLRKILFFFFLNLILLLMHSSLLITLIIYFRVAKVCFVSLLDMVHCRYCLAKKPSLCPVLFWALQVERTMILINDLIILITSGYRVAVYQLYRFQYFFQNIKCHLIQFHVYFSSFFKIQ